MQKVIATCFLIALMSFGFNQQSQAQGRIIKMEVTDFAYEIFSGNAQDGAIAVIQMFGDNKQKGEIRFFPAGKEFKRPEYDSKQGKVSFYYSIDQYMIVKDLLESDKTILIKYDQDNAKVSVVGSDVNRRKPIDPRKQNSSDTRGSTQKKGSSNVKGAQTIPLNKLQDSNERKLKTRGGE